MDFFFLFNTKREAALRELSNDEGVEVTKVWPLSRKKARYKDTARRRWRNTSSSLVSEDGPAT